VRFLTVDDGGKEVAFQGHFKLDPSRKPKEIDVTELDGERKGKTTSGLYEIDGDTLRLCHPGLPGGDRPSVLESKEGSTDYLWTLKRSDKEKLKPLNVDKKAAEQPDKNAEARLWTEVGVKVEMVSASAVRRAKKDLGGGLRVLALRPDSPASKAKIQKGDILVGLHIWETLSIDSCLFILDQCREDEVTSLKYSLVRNGRLQSIFMRSPTQAKLK
jgi:hypothetical protein